MSCGHPAARIRRADGRIEALPAGGLPVGLFEELKVTTRRAWLDRGDLLMIFSDGVTEAADMGGCEFGESRLVRGAGAGGGRGGGGGGGRDRGRTRFRGHGAAVGRYYVSRAGAVNSARAGALTG